MKWTPEKVAELRVLAPQGSIAAADHFGVSRNAVRFAGRRHRVPFGRKGQRHYDAQARETAQLRARWAAILPQKIEAIRRDMAVIMADGPG